MTVVTRLAARASNTTPPYNSSGGITLGGGKPAFAYLRARTRPTTGVYRRAPTTFDFAAGHSAVFAAKHIRARAATGGSKRLSWDVPKQVELRRDARARQADQCKELCVRTCGDVDLIYRSPIALYE